MDTSIDRLFDPGRIGGLVIKNRLVRSATSEMMARDTGEITPQFIDLYRDLARGGAGLMFTGMLYPNPRGRYISKQAGIHDDAMIPALAQLTDQVHAAGGVIFGEIGHAGSQSRDPSIIPLAPSPVENFISLRAPQEASEAEIRDVIDGFGHAARRVREAGFDGVHVHAGHGYLISEFSSPHTNRRTDDWGGDGERRGRFLLETYRAIRRAVGDEFPVTFKLGMADSMAAGGLGIAESLPRAAQLEAEGVDAIEVSVGIMHLTSMSAGEYIGVTPSRAVRDLVVHRLWNRAGEECYFRGHARAIKTVLNKTPVILVGGIRRTETMADIVVSGDADFVSMSRPFIREPDLPNRIKSGKRGLVDCVSCNICLQHELTDPLQCWRKSNRLLFRHLWWKLTGAASR
ncbi:MAG: NADH:flavin oxidoreductase [Proteobacteria bacterium]|nr:NADH:flavin oxidoreductase [Pseudomonadota bacterium]